MLGFFDSGIGGLTIFKDVIKLMPDYSYIYLGDDARAPYGSRSQSVIYKFTGQCVVRLFEEGAILVVLACNTSSSGALRKIQKKFLPKHYSEKKVLGIVIPTAEGVINMTKSKKIGILATEATVRSLVYPKEIKKLDNKIKVYQQACPLLVPAIEAGKSDSKELELMVENYIAQLFKKDKKIDVLILGCTHYELIRNIIKKYVPKPVKIISQGKIVAKKLKNYLKRHPEISNKLEKERKRIFLSTGDSPKVKDSFRKFYGKEISLRKVIL